MAYTPTAADFADTPAPSSYKPSAADFGGEEDETAIRDANIRKMTGFKGLAAETLLNLSNAMKSSVLFGRDLPKMAKEAVAAEEERPLRPYVATGGALADIAKSTVNLPYDLNKFLSRKLDFIPSGEGIIPHIPEDTGVGAVFGLNKEQPEDRLYKGLAGALAMGIPGGGGKVRGIEGGIAPPKILPKHLEQQIAKEKKVLDVSSKRLDKFKESLESHPEYRSAKPSTLRRTAGDLEAKIKEIEPLTKIAAKEVPEIPAAPDTMKMKRVAKEDVTQASESLSKALGEGRRLHREGGEAMLNDVNDIRKSASKQFEDTKDYFKKHDIQIDKSAEIADVRGKLRDLEEHYRYIPGYETDTPDVKALHTQLAALEKPEFVKASNVLDTYRTLDKLAKDAHDKIYERGSNLTQEERTNLKGLASKYESMADQLGNVLEKVGDKNGLEMLRNAKSAWKEYASLYGNPTFQYMEKHKALHPSTMSNLELGTRGNELLNRIVDNNPQLRQAIFGQKYATPSSHKALLRPNEVHDKYLSEMPEIKDLVESLRNAHETEREVRSTASDLKAEHKELADSITQIANEQKLRQDSIANMKKYQELMDKKNKAADLVKKKMNQAVARGENIESLEAKLKELEADRNKLKKLLKQAVKVVYRYGGIKAALKH